jgi:hypothetical protein
MGGMAPVGWPKVFAMYGRACLEIDLQFFCKLKERFMFPVVLYELLGHRVAFCRSGATRRCWVETFSGRWAHIFYKGFRKEKGSVNHCDGCLCREVAHVCVCVK